MKKIIINLFRHELMQQRWGRKYIGGNFYLIMPRGLPMRPFWSDIEIILAQSITLEQERFAAVKKIAVQLPFTEGIWVQSKHGHGYRFVTKINLPNLFEDNGLISGQHPSDKCYIKHYRVADCYPGVRMGMIKRSIF